MDETLGKVPEVALLFWIIKIFATTLATVSVESVSAHRAAKRAH